MTFNPSRSEFLRASLACAGLWTFGVNAKPANSMRLLIPASPGGGWDLTGRALGQALVASGQAGRVDFETRSGAAGTIGLSQFVSRKPDPDALMMMGSVMLGGIISGRPPVGLQDIKPVARLTTEHNVYVVPAKSPFNSMEDVLRRFRSDPDALRWGGGSRGATEHIATAMLAKALGVRIEAVNYVPFRGGGEAHAAVINGVVDIAGSGLSEFSASIRSGQLRALAVTSEQRIVGLNVPTLKELGYSIVLNNWRGVCAHAGLGAAQIQSLIDRVHLATQSVQWKLQVQTHGWTEAFLQGASFADYIQRDYAKLEAVMKEMGLA